jgi:hypothetical protein
LSIDNAHIVRSIVAQEWKRRKVPQRNAFELCALLSGALREGVDALIEKVQRILLGSNNQGPQSYKLMGKDRCLWGFEVKDAALGYNAAKVNLAVTRYVMTDRLELKVVFAGGLGLNLGSPCSISDTA